jgi:hypothetical protein
VVTQNLLSTAEAGTQRVSQSGTCPNNAAALRQQASSRLLHMQVSDVLMMLHDKHQLRSMHAA